MHFVGRICLFFWWPLFFRGIDIRSSLWKIGNDPACSFVLYCSGIFFSTNNWQTFLSTKGSKNKRQFFIAERCAVEKPVEYPVEEIVVLPESQHVH